MHAIYQLSIDELNDKFIESIKTLFLHKNIEIIIKETDNGEEWKTLFGSMPNVGNDEDLEREYLTVNVDEIRMSSRAERHEFADHSKRKNLLDLCGSDGLDPVYDYKKARSE